MGLAGHMLVEELKKRKNFELPAVFNVDEVCLKQGTDDGKEYRPGDKRQVAKIKMRPPEPAGDDEVDSPPTLGSKADLIEQCEILGIELSGYENKASLRKLLEDA